MSEELNEIRRQQQSLLERWMYLLDPAPPKLPPQEYIDGIFQKKRTSTSLGISTTGSRC